MKISLEWLRDFLPQIPTAGAAGDALTHGGLPVEVIEQVGDDTVIDVEVTSNRSDCLSHRGVARELAALLNLSFAPKPTEITEAASERAADQIEVRIDATELCPHYTARVIRNVKIGPSPQWMVRRLTALGVRSVNNVVDVTNYVMFELGQPLHAFDFDKIKSGKMIVREARAGESIVSLDSHQRKLTAGMLVIADPQQPLAIAGVMGGRDSEVTAATTNILLESARFDPLSIRKTARALSMKSDSSYRYERGIDPNLPAIASVRAAELIAQLAGGTVLSGVVEAGTSGAIEKRLTLRATKIKRVLGVEFDPAIVTDALTRLGFAPQQQPADSHPAEWTVTIPSARLDINLEIDLVEEVARVIGYDHIPVRDEIAIRVTPADQRLITIDKIRTSLAASGYSEAITVSFVSDDLAAKFTPPGHQLLQASSAVRKADARLRPSLLPSLLESVRRNESLGTADAKLFEIGSAFWSEGAGDNRERRRVTFVGGDFSTLRGVLESLLAKLDSAKRVDVVPMSQVGFGSAGSVQWGGRQVGVIGLIDRPISTSLGLRISPAAAEIDLQELLDGARHDTLLRPLPRFPSVQRDLSLIVPDATPYAAIADTVESCGLSNLETLAYVTTYRGKPLEKGTKSVTLQLSFRSPNETLTTESVDATMQRAIDAAVAKLQAVVRS